MVNGQHDYAGGRMTYDEAVYWLFNLNVDGITEWRLPQSDGDTTLGINRSLLTNEMGHLYYISLNNPAYPVVDVNTAPFINVQHENYWYSTQVSGAPMTFNFGNGYTATTTNKTLTLNVWAVHNGDVGATVPVPAAI
jgi:hypothetical protein